MVLTLSAAAAYGLVFCVMKLFYRLFLQIDGAQITVVWNCFFLDARHFIPVLGGLLLLGLTASLLFCRQYRCQEPLSYMRLEPVLKHPARRFTLRKSGGVPMCCWRSGKGAIGICTPFPRFFRRSSWERRHIVCSTRRYTAAPPSRSTIFPSPAQSPARQTAKRSRPVPNSPSRSSCCFDRLTAWSSWNSTDR